MTIKLYFDEDSMRQSLIMALKSRGINVTTALDEKMIAKSDAEHLEYATKNGWTLFSFNVSDFYRLHNQYMLEGKSHAGIILSAQQQYSTGEQMRRILRLISAKSAEDMKNWIEFLSSWG